MQCLITVPLAAGADERGALPVSAVAFSDQELALLTVGERRNRLIAGWLDSDQDAGRQTGRFCAAKAGRRVGDGRVGDGLASQNLVSLGVG
jgi:hypothetical protein